MEKEQKTNNNCENNVPNNSTLQSPKGMNKNLYIYFAIGIIVGFIAIVIYYSSSTSTNQTIMKEHNYETEIGGEEYYFTLQNCSTEIHLFINKPFATHLWEASLYENDIKKSKWDTQENLATAFNFMDYCIKNNMFIVDFKGQEELTINFLMKAEPKNISLPLIALRKKMKKDFLVNKILHSFQKQKKKEKILSEEVKILSEKVDILLKDAQIKNYGDRKEKIIEMKKTHNNTIHPDSKILTNGEYNALKKWIHPNSEKVNFKLLCYATGNIDISKFHTLVDNKGATITIIRSGNGYLFGGYTTIPLGSLNDYKYDNNAFTFSLSRGVKCKIRNNGYAIYRTASNMINFGEEEIVIKNNCFSSADSYSRGGSSYEIPNQYDPTTFYAGAKNFLVHTIEVYKVTIQ